MDLKFGVPRITWKSCLKDGRSLPAHQEGPVKVYLYGGILYSYKKAGRHSLWNLLRKSPGLINRKTKVQKRVFTGLTFCMLKRTRRVNGKTSICICFCLYKEILKVIEQNLRYSCLSWEQWEAWVGRRQGEKIHAFVSLVLLFGFYLLVKGWPRLGLVKEAMLHPSGLWKVSTIRAHVLKKVCRESR